ncbi:motility associated factor glycosyltransferase family protein [Campylobacter upsaliensis]|uniref:motility associated factor glycosyltransferase family protein n=1 Tax=Campylobacter upsaliensis TaxID=28080 RepID=UPI002149E55D|nr:motility associated factor glycosyltransferase family protein [Campylobacter upsaliensis]MCR2104639.1 motility associated factor glycosyltransferase family protein [Campylobacter upsaliensis]
MDFNARQMMIFEANLNAIEDENLKKELSEIVAKDYQFSQGDDPLDINANGGGGGNSLLYQNPLGEVQSKAAFYQQKFALYPVLFFYGIGNGVLLKILFQNPTHKLIIVFERELEILWHILHFLDFSKELTLKRLCFFDTKKLDDDQFNEICERLNIFARIYHLELMCAFYENFREDFARINGAMREFFDKSTLRYGNDIEDCLMGLSNFVHNLPKMLTNPSLKTLKKTYEKCHQNAIIVSTGPSLSKQLPLLKQYASKAVIFAADSAYPILAKYGIKPDFVFMVERTDFTAEFFNNDFKEFDAGVLFILAAVVHPRALELLEKNHRPYIIVPRNYDFAYYCDFKEYGYATDSVSVAHMAFELAKDLEFENIIFIGQDLAFDEEGNSHPKDYLHKADYESGTKAIQILAYGGKGLVKTHEFWLIFKHMLELLIIEASKKGIKIYNATEGGVRIKGAFEKPFSECCEEFLNKPLKPLPPLKKPNQNKQNEWLLKAFAKIFLAIKKCEKVEGELEMLFANLNYENLDNEALRHLSFKLDDLKEKLLNSRPLLEVLRPSLHSFELKFMQIFVIKPQNEEQKREKILALVRLYLWWLGISLGSIKKEKMTLQNHIKPLELELKKRNFLEKITKWQEKAAKI